VNGDGTQQAPSWIGVGIRIRIGMEPSKPILDRGRDRDKDRDGTQQAPS